MAASISQQHSQHQSSIFSSVFPPYAVDHSSPTPVATPDLGSAAAGHSFGGFSHTEGGSEYTAIIARQEVRRNAAWSVVTRFLSFPRPTVPKQADAEHFENTFCARPARSAEVTKDLEYLLVGEGVSKRLPGESLVDWYINEVRLHFLAYHQSTLTTPWQADIEFHAARDTINATVMQVQRLLAKYIQPVAEHIAPILDESRYDIEQGRYDNGTHVSGSVPRLHREIQTVLVNAIPLQRFFSTLSYVFFDTSRHVFRLHPASHSATENAADDTLHARDDIMTLLQQLQDIGLGGEKSQRAFAHAMDRLMSEFMASRYMKVDWFEKTSVMKRLREWIHNGFAPFVADALYRICDDGDSLCLATNELRQWQEMAIVRLGRSRVDNLFEYVVNWDTSLGAILDLKEYITTPQARNYLTTAFWRQLSGRLLHAGATTTHILDVYIHVIRAFNELDAKGVLLDRVARPIRRYLKEREDTARIIISSLLADLGDAHSHRSEPVSDISVEIAAEMNNPSLSGGQDQDQELDWNNLSWTPDPIDAGPEFRKSKSEDIISSLLSLYDREDFISELKSILGEHLLKNEDSDFEKEIRLLELFKLRLGEDKLQACEVMLRDMLESKRINTSIGVAPPPTAPVQAETNATCGLQAQILSRFFWPALREDSFRVPTEIQKLQSRYTTGFEQVKDMRTLDWLPALGRVTIELHLDDRQIELDVQPWQASVIYAFQSDQRANSRTQQQPITRTAQELERMLEMDEDLVRNALSFWIGKRVLIETSEDHFTTLERLDGQEAGQEAEAAAAAEETEAISAVKSLEDVLAGNMDLYRQFVMGMLMNRGAMPAPRILMMLKMVVPGGFPFGVEEVRTVLGRMVEEGRLVGTGDAFSVRKDDG